MEIQNQSILIQDLHSDALIEIFKFLPQSDLISSSLVCKYFDEIINKSSKICSQFQVKFTSSKKNHPWIGNRKYNKFRLSFIFDDDFKEFLKIFFKIGSQVNELTLDSCSIAITDLKHLFNMCPNLKRLKFIDNYLSVYHEGFVKLTSLEFLEYEGLSIYISMFDECKNLKDLKISGYDSDWPRAYFEKFLMRQRNLENLKIFNINSFEMMFGRENLCKKSHFRLKSLSLGEINMQSNFRNFIEFMKLHRESLEYLEIREFNQLIFLLSHLQDFKNLKTLKIADFDEKIDFLSIEPLVYVEKLILQCKSAENFIIKFPNLKNLCLIDMKVNREVSSMHIQKLKLIKCKIPSKFVIPKYVTELSLISCDVRSLKIDSKMIKKATIKNCKNASKWMKDLIDNVKKLEVINVKIEHKIYDDLMKVEELVIANVRIMKRVEEILRKFCCFL